MSRLIVVSNRLPFSCRKTEEGYEFGASSGGLVTALSSYIERRRKEDASFECIWLGWPGTAVSAADQPLVAKQARAQYGAHPVFLSPEETSQFYDGFSNSTLWPLFHYFPSYASYDADQWQSYKQVNERFCAAVTDIAQPGDTIWVHDYQLLLLPKLIRGKINEISIGFFLHIPFPSFEVFRHLPTHWRVEILEGMLGADLLGFHTHDYVQYFLRSVFRTLGHEHTFGQLAVGGDIRRAEAFPIGIDFDRFSSATETQEVIAARLAMTRSIGDRKVVFSVDRLDYSKGLLHRLRGYEMLLELNPEWRQRVVFVLSVVPSREEVPQYQRMKQELDELVGQINGKYGGVDWAPIIYQYRNLGFSDLVALYNLADVALITPLRDGMNLVAKEYLACKPDGTGVLILSEMAGAARELGEALQVNPNHKEEIAASLNEALKMTHEEQIRRNRPMRDRLKSYDAAHWVTAFLSALRRVKDRQGELATLHLRGPTFSRVLERHSKATRRLVLLDYDGTLVSFAAQPHLAAPDAGLIDLIAKLGSSPNQHVCVVSGRDQNTLLEWLGDLPITLIGEHGAWIRKPGEGVEMLKPLFAEWKQHVRPLLQLYVDRVPGSLLEEKQFSLAWHYRRSDPEHGALRAKELIDDITAFTANFDVQVIEGKKVVEIRTGGVNKGVAAMHCVATYEPDFIFTAGDDATDEDLFRALPATAVTVRVGNSHSHATYRVKDHRELRELLEQIASNPSQN